MKQNIRKVRHFWSLGTSACPNIDFLLKVTPYGQFARKFWQIGHNERFSEGSQENQPLGHAIWSKNSKTKPNDCIFHSFANQMQSLIRWMDQNFINFSNLESNLLPDEGFRPESGFQRLEPPFLLNYLMISISRLLFSVSTSSRRCSATNLTSPPFLSAYSMWISFNLDCGCTRKTRSRAGNP